MNSHNQATSERRQGEERNWQLAEFLPQIVWTARPDGTIDYANSRALIYLGISLEALARSGWAEAIHPDDRSEAEARWADSFRTAAPLDVEARLRRADGEYRWHLFRQIAQHDESGSPLRWFGTCTDIHKQKAKESEFRELADAMPQIVWRTDPAGRFDYQNRRGLEAVGPNVPDDALAACHPEDLPHLQESWEESLRLGMPHESEYRLRVRPSGEYRWYLSRAVPVRDAAGRITAWYGTSTDIHDRKKIESALQQTTDLLRAVTECSPDAIFVKNREGKYLLFNAAAGRFVGMRAEDVIGKDDAELFDPEGARAIKIRDKRVMESGIAETEEEILTAAGVRRTYLATKAPYCDPSGKAIGVIGISRDITERKEAEIAARESDAILAQAGHLSHLGGWQLDLENLDDLSANTLRCTDETYRIFGYKPGEVRPTVSLFYERVHPEDCDFVDAAFRGAIERGEPYEIEHRILRPDGSERIVLERAEVVLGSPGRTKKVIGAVQDITERRKAADELERTRERMRLILDTANDPFVTVDVLGRIIDWNRQAEAVFGWSREEAIGRMLHETIVPERYRSDCQRGWGELQSSGRGAIFNQRLEQTALQRNGSEIPVELLVWPVRSGGTITISAFVRDITERKRSESALHAAEKRLHDIVSTSPAVLFTIAIAPDASILGIDWISPNVAQMLGYSPEDATARKWWLEKIHPDEREAASTRAHQSLFETGHIIHEYRFQHRDGTYRWLRSELRMLREGENRRHRVVGSWSDITEQKHLESQFQQSQKMEAVGRLAGGIAHDFNNLLTVINGYGDLMLAQFPADDPHRESIAQIRDAGGRAARLTQQLLAFSRKAVVEIKSLDLNELVEDSAKLLRRLIGEDINLTIVLDPSLPRIKADSGQLEQVIMNLAVNARDAMPAGGRLTIETRSAAIRPSGAKDSSAKPVRYVKLTVADTGMGMTDEVKAKIFEPFFTTKEVGKGTGLGLAVVHGIVEQSGGRIAAFSKLGVGTRFEILFPAATEIAPDSGEVVARVPSGGSETILVVEDEAMVRTIVKLALTTQGYTVLEAARGRDAIRTIEKQPGKIQLLLTDVVMPEMSGRELVEAARKLQPSLRVVYMSGYTENAPAIREGDTATAYIQKPFAPLALARKVRAMLDCTK